MLLHICGDRIADQQQRGGPPPRWRLCSRHSGSASNPPQQIAVQDYEFLTKLMRR